MLTTYAFLDSGSTVSFTYQSVKDQLQAKGTDVTLNIAGIHGTQDLRIEKVPFTIKRLHSKVHSIEAFARPSTSLGNTTYGYKELKNNFRHPNVLTNRTFNLMEVGIILEQDDYKIQRPLDYKIATRSEPFAVLTKLGWVVSGPTTGKKSQKWLSFCVHRRCESGRKYPIMEGQRNLCFQNKCCKSIKERAASSEVFREHNKIYCRALWNRRALEWTRAHSSKQIRLALGQLYSLERRLQKNPNLKEMFEQSIDADVEKGFVKILNSSDVSGNFGKAWYLPQHSVLNSNKPGKNRRVCNAAVKYNDVCLNDQLLARPDLINRLIGTIFRFWEGPIALTADIESMFLQVQVPGRDKSCLRFLWRTWMNEPVQIYECKRHVFGATSSPTRANYALKRVAINNEDEFPIAAKTIQNHFYMDDFIKSVKTPEEAINVFKQLQPLLSKHEFEVKKWIINSDVVTNAIPEDLRSISDKKFEMEPSKEVSSVLGLKWTITDDSLQVCRGTSKDVETPITQGKILCLVSSVFDPLGLSAPFSVHMRRHLDQKSIWTKKATL